MKTYAYKIILLMFALTANMAVNAQTKEEHHNSLSEHHKTASEHLKAIHTGASKTKKEHLAHADSAGKSLENARRKHEDVKKSVQDDHKVLAKPHHDAIEQYYITGANHHKSLKTELAKENPDESKVKEHAKNMDDALTSAEKEHQQLKEKTTTKYLRKDGAGHSLYEGAKGEVYYLEGGQKVLVY